MSDRIENTTGGASRTMTESERAESLAQSEVEVIEYLLHEQTPESHQTEMTEERWFIELGERVAFDLAFGRLGDSTRFLINDVWPYLYRLYPEAFEPIEVPRFEDDPVAKRLGLTP